MFPQMHSMNDPNQSYDGHCRASFPLQHPLSNQIIPNCCRYGFRCHGLHGGSTPVIALTAASCSPTLRSSPLSIMYFNVYMYMHFDQWWATPSGLLPWDSHQTMTSVLVWDTGRPNGDKRHPLVPVGPVVRGTAATCCGGHAQPQCHLIALTSFKG